MRREQLRQAAGARNLCGLPTRLYQYCEQETLPEFDLRRQALEVHSQPFRDYEGMGRYSGSEPEDYDALLFIHWVLTGKATRPSPTC